MRMEIDRWDTLLGRFNRGGATAVAVMLAAAAAGAARGQTAPIRLAVDAREAPRGIYHIHETLPATPGATTLVYPKWIPGAHGPVGPIVNVVGLKLTVDGKAVAWRRDDVDMFAIHCDVPAGAATLDAAFDFVAPGQANSLAVVTWNQLLMYPAGKASDDMTFAASAQLPAGWKYGTALPVASEGADGIVFKTVSLTTLVDSPVLSGAHYREVPLNVGQTPTHFIDMVSDSETALDMKPEQVGQYEKLVNEAGALFGARHYSTYHWLVTFNSHVSGGGLEHHESSDDRVDENALATEGGRRRLAGLLAHEYIHSWNGKYRRPAGLATPNYQEPMKGELLWVYEGLTEYLATVLCPRAGLESAAEMQEHYAEVAAGLDYTAGRAWRPLLDTTVGAQILYSSPAPWRDYRRSTDFYPEGTLLWLEVDVMIRQQTEGKKSLDDFCQAFHGGGDSGPKLKPYTEEEVVATLNDVAPYDWKGFFDQRINGVSAPLDGLAKGGWKLIYTDTPSDDVKYREGQQKTTNLMYSLGLQLGNEDALVKDIVPGSAADKAGVSPGMKLVGLNGRKWTPELLKAAVKASPTAKGTIDLLVEDNEFYKTLSLDYHDGARYPHLVRDGSKPDVLSEIFKARATK